MIVIIIIKKKDILFPWNIIEQKEYNDAWNVS